MARWVKPNNVILIGSVAVFAILGSAAAVFVEHKPQTSKPVAVIKDPVSTTYAMDKGALTVIEIPLPGSGRLSERQTCFLWRDDGYRTASMQCPNDKSSFSVDNQ